MATLNAAGHMDPGFVALSLFLRLHGVSASADQIRERCDGAPIGVRQMLRCARELGLGVRAGRMRWKRLAGLSLPGIAGLRDGGFLLVGKVDDVGALVVHPPSPRAASLTRTEFEAIWDGRVISAGSATFAGRLWARLCSRVARARGALHSGGGRQGAAAVPATEIDPVPVDESGLMAL